MNHFILTGRVKDRTFKHIRYAVICKTLHDAIKLCEMNNPNMEILSVTHQGAIDYVEVI